MPGRTNVFVAIWLLLLAAAQVFAFVEVLRFFVRTGHGQLLDTAALTGNSIGWAKIEDLVGTTLNAISVLSLVVATVVIVFIALARGRIVLAVAAILLIAGANVTTQLVKYVTIRPNLGIDVERAAAGNSLPSGHTAVVGSVAVALVLVLPARVRGVGAVVGASLAALAGVATLSAGWHRPSDAVAALLIVGAWAAAAGLLLIAAQRVEPVATREPVRSPHRVAVALLVVAGVALLAVAAVALNLTEQVLDVPADELSRRRLFAAYAGGAAGIAGTAAVVTALVLATVHRVVPPRAA